MPVRRCTEADIPDVARVCARACAEDPLLGDLMHPHRDQYPEDFVEYFRKRLAEHFYESAHHHLITFETQGAAEVITGYADWLRHDEGDGEDRASTTKTDTLENRAADPEKADVVERAEEFTKHYWTGARAKTWFLDLLVVDPEHQRKGCGRDLVCFGLHLARQEGFCASLIASEIGEILYRSCGFAPVGWVQEGEGNPLHGLPGGRIMFCDPMPS